MSREVQRIRTLETMSAVYSLDSQNQIKMD